MQSRPHRIARPQPPKGKGPALLPGPPAPSEGSAGVRQLAGPKANRSSILAHQLRLPLLGNREPGPKTGPPPPVYGPSWGIRSSRPALPAASPKEGFGAASRKRQIPLPAPLPGWPRRSTEVDRHCRPAEIGSSVPSSSPGFPREGPPSWRLGRPPRSPLEHDSFTRVAKAEN
jgi:hypothetical protein